LSSSKQNTKKERRNSEVENHTENPNVLLSLSSLLTRFSFFIYIFLFSQKRYVSRAVTEHGNKGYSNSSRRKRKVEASN